MNAFSMYVPTKTVIIRPSDQPWCNSFTRLLLRRKNCNYNFYKKAYTKYINELNKVNTDNEILSRLKVKKCIQKVSQSF